jgi:hypothetical protein
MGTCRYGRSPFIFGVDRRRRDPFCRGFFFNNQTRYDSCEKIVAHMNAILLAVVNVNPSEYEHEAEILEFTIRQPSSEKLEAILTANSCILRLSIAIRNHMATRGLLEAAFQTRGQRRPVMILGGPEASSLDEDVPFSGTRITLFGARSKMCSANVAHVS